MKRINTYTLTLLALFSLLTSIESSAWHEHAPREHLNIDFNWKFNLGDTPEAKQKDFDDSQWRKLNVPHDWSIEGEYSEDNPAGIAGGFLPTGTGWYRKDLAYDNSWENNIVQLTFDGVYMNSEVWVNGNFLGKRPYGYSSFQYDITPYLEKGNNVIAVKVDNSLAPSGRWYTGSGIYRHVWLTKVAKQHVPYSGVFVRSENVSEQSANILITTEVANKDKNNQQLTVLSELVNKQGSIVASTRSNIALMAGDTHSVKQNLSVENPQLWDTENPYLYSLKTSIIKNDKTIDIIETPTGIRSIEISVEKGFVLNGKPVELQGMSMHHDAGPVGAAVPDDVLRKRLVTLKEMGVNAIRTTHNPFAPEFYQMANEMGFMLMNEVFDGWWVAKAEYDYGLYFDEWWQTDLRDFIKRDRSHPSVVMWSIGNEVRGYKPAQQKQLLEFINTLDTTRPVTQGSGYDGGQLNIAGFNGHGEFKNVIEKFHQENPTMPIIGTEMTHTIHTRGVFRSKSGYRVRDFPAPWETGGNQDPKKKWNRIKSSVYKIEDFTEKEVFPEFQSAYGSSYDNSVVRMPIKDEIKLARDLPYFLGTFRWTAFDYIGESFGWPARTANFGIIDLAGFPKGPYYLYQSQWSKKPMVHLDPHWTHPGKEGVEIPVVVYTNQESAELFLNGKSLGEKKVNDKMELVWLVPYSEGELSVVAKANGKDVIKKSVQSAKQAYSIKINADKYKVSANQTDVVHLELDVVDEHGVMVPSADNLLTISISGPGKLIGVENGDILDLNPHKVPTRKAFMGKALALVQSTDQKGPICVTVKSEGLIASQFIIEAK